MNRLRVAKQFAREKMGKVEKISESNDVRYCAEINDENRAHLKEIQKKLKKQHKGLQGEVEQTRLLSASLIGYSEKLSTFVTTQQIATCTKSIADMETMLASLQETLNRNVLSSCQYPLGALVKSELLDAANSKAKYDKVRRNYDAACAEHRALEEKGKKTKSLAEIENQVAEAKKEFERVGLDTLIVLQITNKKAEFTVMDKLCDLFDSYDEFFAKGAAYLSQLRPQIQNYRSHIAQLRREYDNLKDSSSSRPSIKDQDPASKDAKVLQPMPMKYFSVPLADILKREGSSIPRLISKAIDYLISSGAIRQEGIFRLSGNISSLQQLQEKADTGQDIDFASVDDANVVSGFIKKWLRDLPEPLLTFGLHDDFLKMGGLRHSADYVPQIRALLAKLPQEEHRMLTILMSLCMKISSLSAENKMTPANLATVLGPNLARPPEMNPLTMMEAMQSINGVVESLISLYNELFEPRHDAVNASTDNNNDNPQWFSSRGTFLAKAEEGKADSPLPPMVRRDSVPLPKLPPPRKIPPKEHPASRTTNESVDKSNSLTQSAPTTGASDNSQISILEDSGSAMPLNTEKEDPGSVDGTADDEDREFNTTSVDINTRIQREGSGVILRRLLRATCRLSAAAAQDRYTPAHVSTLNGRITSLAQTLRDMFPSIKVYVAQHPTIKNELIDSSREVQEKAKGIIFAIKQVNAAGGGDSQAVISSMRDMVASIHRLLNACESGAVPELSSLASLVQQCAQHTTKLLHIAFSASDENLEVQAKAALLCSEKLYHRVNIKSPELQNTETQKALLDATSNIDKLINKLASMARKLLADPSDTQEAAAIREVAKELASSFRLITTLANSTHTPQTLSREQETQLLAEAFDTLKSMVDNFFNEGTMLSHEIKMIDHTRILLAEIGKLSSAYTSLSAEGLLALALCISKKIWEIDGMVADVAIRCSDPDLIEQLYLYKRAVCHYEFLLLLGVSAKLVDKGNALETFASWVTPPAATSGLCGSIVPLLKDFFLASLLQAD